ncbi:MAG: PAS domain S-box protein [Deltaproteobacteria bacterium]|nr:PAS domain S-box protein [Deltaproteobacteria bacterium]
MDDNEALAIMRRKVNELAEVLGEVLFPGPDALFSHLLDSLQMGICIYGADHRFVYANKTLADLGGYGREELLGREITDFIPPEELPVLAAHLEKRKSGDLSSYEISLIKKGGEKIKVIAAGHPLVDETGRFMGGFVVFSDISERLALEGLLREKEERLAQLVQNAPAGIVEMDLRSNRFISVNDVVCRLTGFSREEILTMPASELFAGEDREVHRKRVADILAGKPVAVNWEYRINKKGGGLIWVLINMSIGYEDGIPVYSRVVATNITEQKLVQELTAMQRDLAIALGKAHDASEVFRLLLNTLLTIEGVDFGAVYIFNPDSGALELAEQLGLSDEFVAGASSFPADSVYAKAVMRGKAIYHNYEMIQSSEGGTRRAEGMRSFLMMPLNDEDRVIGCLNTGSRTRAELPRMVRDFLVSMSAHLGSLIARLKAEKRRSDTEQKYRTLVENATDAICIVQDGIIKFANPVALSMTGYPEAEMTGISFLQLLHPEDHATATQRHRKRLSGKLSGKAHNYRFITKAGETALAQLSGGPIMWEGRPAVLMVARDITDEKRIEEQLAHAERMEAVGTLAGGVAHDFNNLLMAIQGNISLMLLSLPEDSPLVERLKSIEGCVQSGTRLTGQLLGYARGGKYAVATIDLNLLVQESAQLFGRARKEICLNLDLAPDLWRVEVDRIQLEQVLLNLFVNAWHALPGGGDIIASTRNVVLSEEDCAGFGLPAGFYVRLSIADNGVGMDEAVKKRIFEPFFTTRQKGAGAGLGLASSYAIIKNHRGMIHVLSEPKKGATFSIFLPATDKDPEVTTAAGFSLFRGEGLVMLVDDDPMILDVAASMLAEMGFRVISANGGKKAVELFRARASEITLVILDLVMPDMNGGETFKKLREERADIPVILASGYGETSQIREIMAGGGVEFLQKPFDMTDLSAKLRKILSK